MVENKENISQNKEMLEYAAKMRGCGITNEKLIQYLQEKGLDEDQAKKLLNFVEQELLQVKKAKGKINIIMGIIIIIVAASLFIFINIAMVHRGSTIIILPIGVVFFGFYKLILGIVQRLSKNPVNYN